ncbi:hypothetical protein D5086_033829 [Populus alba]|uniref:Uncharacterized protein n=1 Tax=Populus alba TaxID=43335 RepID=A0ACC4AHU2_POPAL
MVRFSCFSARIHSHKSKKTAQPSDEARHKSLEDLSHIQALPLTKSSRLILPKAQAGNQISNGVRDATRADVSVEQSWKSDKTENKMDDKNDMGGHQTRLIRKSQSLGSGLCHEGRVLCDNDTEEIDQGVYSDSLDQNGLLRPDGSKDSGISTTSEHEKALQLGSFHGSYGFVKKECIFSIDNRHYSEKEGPENSETPFSGDGGNLSGNQSPHSPPMIEKSCSFSDMGPYALTSHGHSFEYLAPQSRSSEDLHDLGKRLTTISIQGGETQKMKEQGRDDNMPNTEENNIGSCIDEGFESYNYSALAQNWIMPVMDEVNLAKDLQGESSTQQWEELPSKDFKMKRIKDWVNNLQHFGPLEETNGLPGTDDPVKGDSNDLTSAKVDNKDAPGIEAAKRYISSLSVSATTAHLSNHELAVIPFLGVFGSLRMLNLSGNSIELDTVCYVLDFRLMVVAFLFVSLFSVSIKASTLKDTADRSVRLGISSHQFDRGLRSDNKAVRKASHGLGGARPYLHQLMLVKSTCDLN